MSAGQEEVGLSKSAELCGSCQSNSSVHLSLSLGEGWREAGRAVMFEMVAKCEEES